MPLNAKLLRRWFLASGIVLLCIVSGFYFYARYRVRSAIHELPKKLGIEVQQSTSGFTFSKSEGGRTLFSVSAARATQFKQGQRAALEDVRIIIYGLNDHYDQIYGKSFEYDPESGEVRANGTVGIDLEATGKPQAADPGGAQGAVHLKTGGLVFNQKTGKAMTDQQVDFAFPQASGHATGAQYDSKSMTLTLASGIVLDVTPASGRPPVAAPGRLTAQSAVVTDQPREAILRNAHFDQPERSFSATNLTISLRENNTIKSVIAEGDVREATRGKSPSEIRAAIATFDFDNSAIHSAQLTGGVELTSSGAGSSARAHAARVDVSFAGKNQLEKLRASGNAHLEQTAANGQQSVVDAEALDILFRGNRASRVLTSGRSQIALTQPSKPNSPAARTVITAGDFTGEIVNNRLRSLHGAPDARIVSSSTGQPDRISTSRSLDAVFDPAHGTLLSATQTGDFHYQEGAAADGRTASAASATYSARDESLLLHGSPSFQDRLHGLAVSANDISINRSGEASATGNVKTTYAQTKSSTSGAMLSGSETIHVTSSSATSDRKSDSAHFAGGVRLWQGANVIEAPQMDFSRGKNSLVASGTQPGSVTTVFVQTDRSGKVTPVSVTSTRLTYSEAARKAHFDGRVTVKDADATLKCDQADILLRAKNSAASAQPSQLESIIAQGNVQIVEEKPSRKASGSRLVYTAAEEKWVLTGEKGIPPSIFDAEHGDLTGDSLTFYSHGDTVRVGSDASSRTITRTTVKDASPH